ncbi:hypothetical protein OE88DRAFT_1643961 [Heliocybe sulcata]|uniref:Homeobox domain-containing protein n=1 Tax=Heliocybe sulcata TaxID=5364 RepID=A0A5C3N6U9_9AGAM|nr:hypothetical protein OE88DRAFT_1643961 [Heliocybe sulcata]
MPSARTTGKVKKEPQDIVLPPKRRAVRASEEQIKILKAAFAAAPSRPRTKEDNLKLSKETGLSTEWINSWFVRQRKQARQDILKVKSEEPPDTQLPLKDSRATESAHLHEAVHTGKVTAYTKTGIPASCGQKRKLSDILADSLPPSSAPPSSSPSFAFSNTTGDSDPIPTSDFAPLRTYASTPPPGTDPGRNSPVSHAKRTYRVISYGSGHEQGHSANGAHICAPSTHIPAGNDHACRMLETRATVSPQAMITSPKPLRRTRADLIHVP